VRLLLDTHAFLLGIEEPETLTPKLRRLLEDSDNERWVSVVSLWEIAIKVQIGKLPLPRDPTFYKSHIELLQARTLAVSIEHSLCFLSLPLHHRDPFDRLLIAQASEENLTLVTRDKAFRRYGVDCIW